MPFSNILRFFSDPSSMNSLAIALMLMLTIMLMVFTHYYFSVMPSSSNSSAPEKEKSSAPEKEESFSNSSDPSLITTEVSTSTSSSEMRFKYDVFLSFRGEDTRKNFVGHLYQALQRNSIETYKDDEKINKGERINDQLLKSIQESRFYIIVFSKNYASSSWCLDELVEIMDCQKTRKQTTYPIFFDVEPTEVRKQSGAVKHAFAKHEKKEAAGKWREALKEASNLAGWELKATANGDESKLIDEIVNAIFIKKYSTLRNTDEKLVGMETRISDVLSSLKIGTEDVRMIGIKGIGGGGKTTLARAVYDQISNRFEGKSFVDDVREVSKLNSKSKLPGLNKLQKRILKDVLNNKQDINISSVHDGKIRLKDTLSRRKTLLVLDDVDRIEQLEALAGEPDWFKPGSRIIITTRDEQVLSSHRVKFVHNVNLLSPMEAIRLFSMHAFPIELPVESYKKLSGQVLRYASGLPLTIKLLGSLLCGKNKGEWEQTIERLEKIPLEKTMEILKLSFDDLEREYQEIFLDVACILKGWGKEHANRVLESRGFYAENGLRVLERKSLITYNEDKELGMHDHLKEMGRVIVRGLYPNEDEPNKHSRLWIDEEIEDILTNDQGTKATKCLYLRSQDLTAEIAIKGLAKMKDLRFIFIRLEKECRNLRHLNPNPKFVEGGEYLPSSLRYMKWIGFPFSSLPDTFQGKHLVELDIHCSNIDQLWEVKGKVLNKLKFLRIVYSKLRTFDLTVAPNLEQLTIEISDNFKDLCIPADRHSKLIYLTLRRLKLTSLHLGNTSNLKILDLHGCPDLVEFQMPAESLKLERLDLHSKLTNLHLGNTPDLKILDLHGCSDLVELQMPAESIKLEHLNLSHSKLTNLHLGNTPNLKILVLEGCNELVELQMPAESLKLEHLDLTDSKLTNLHLGNTPNLKKLKLSDSKLKTLHLGSTPNLEMLTLEDCNDLVEFQMSAESLNLKHLEITHSKLKTIHLGSTPNLEKLILDGCNDLVEFQIPAESLMLEELYLSHSKLRTLDLRLTPNLKSLNLKNCFDLVDINAPVGHLKKLSFVDLSCCGRFKSFEFQKQLDSDEFACVSELRLMAEPTDVCPLHCDNDYLKFQFSCSLTDSASSNFERLISVGFSASINKSFSRSISSLQGIKNLTLEGSFTEAPRDLDQLECLEELIFSYTKIKYLPDSICKLKHLKSFKIRSCRLLEKLPDDIGKLESLEKLSLIGCELLQDIPNSICKMKCINSFHLRGCIRVNELPEDIGCLEGLKELNIQGTDITRLPQSIFQLRGLCIVGPSTWLRDTYGLLPTKRRTYNDDDDEMVCYI